MSETSVAAKVRVWDLPVRLLHWTLAISVAISFATHKGGGALHDGAGYVALAAALLRIVWGFAGPGHARFADFVRGPLTTWRYGGEVLARREARHLGHNPLGGYMILALLANALVCGLSGWLYTTEAFWGVAWVERLHGVSGHLFLLLVPLHVAGVLIASRRHRENLIGAMLTGEKRAG